mgnify:FL=1
MIGGFIMREFWNTIQLIFTAVGGWLGWFLGGSDGLLFALIAFVVIDYITGVERKEKLTEAGYDYSEVQKRVNEMFG